MEKDKVARGFPRSFYVANTMEIFERLAWYGFFTVSSLYMTTPLNHGGLGFSDQERGFLQGIVPFILYLLPVFTGALADRYGYRKMFILSLLVMGPSYYFLGQVHSFWGFCAIFTMVAIGAAIFKPIAVGTVGRTTDDSNRGLGFGVFYMMVNVGGFVGPIVAGYVRAISWDLVFAMSSFWIFINLLPAIFLYREPAKLRNDHRSVGEVLLGAREVLGNARLLIFAVPFIALLMIFAKGGHSLWALTCVVVLWLAINLAWSRFAVRRSSPKWYFQPIKLGNANFVAYLLILSVFWGVYFQIFLTLPLYIRDFVDTSDLVRSLGVVLPGSVDFLAHVNVAHLASFLAELPRQGLDIDHETLQSIRASLTNFKVLVPEDALQSYLHALREGSIDTNALASELALKYRQIAPEYIINVEFLVIILLQILTSHVVQRYRSLPVLVAGIVTLGLSMLLIGLAGAALGSGVVVLSAVVIFAVAEMIASPKSQEYVAAVAPQEKTAMFMGYYFISMALGNLFGGLLSGWAYSTIAKDMNRPMMMWVLFAVLAIMSAVAMLTLDRKMCRSSAGATGPDKEPRPACARVPYASSAEDRAC